MPPKKRRPVGRAQLLALGLLGITVVGAPLLLGGVPAWARILIEVASWLSLVAAIWATRRSVRDAPPSAWLVMSLVLVGVTAVQVAPMPLSWLAWLAPESASAVRSTQQALGQGDASWGALSMDPGATLAALLQGLGLVSVAVAAWLLALAGRRRLVLWLLVASAGVMAFVALGHEAAGADKVFGLYDPRFVHPHPLSPLLNLNHLSALLSVGAVLSLGLAAEQRGGRRVTTLVLSVTLVATTLLTASRGGVASLLGAVVLGASVPLLDAHVVDGAGFMLLTGLGSYLIYVPFNSVLFERLMAATGSAGTAVFSISLADALGYTGSVGAQIQKDLFEASESRLLFFRSFSLLFAAVSVVGLSLALMYFLRRLPARDAR